MRPICGIPLLFLMLSCAYIPSTKTGQTTGQEVGKLDVERCVEAEVFANSLRENPNVYWGDGSDSYEIGGSGPAKELARRRALKHLSEGIKVDIRADIIDILISKERVGGKFTEKIERRIEKKVKYYTGSVLIRTKTSPVFIDCPIEGDLTYYVWIDKKQYDELVKRDLEAKKTMVTSIAQAGHREYSSKEFIGAVTSWLKAYSDLTKNLENIPLYAVIDESNVPMEMNSYLFRSVKDFFSNIVIEVLNDNFQYNSQGEININPIIRAYYINGNNPVNKLPLRAKFSYGSGRISEVFATKAPRGQAELIIRTVDPSTRSATIIVEIDTSKFNGLEKFDLMGLETVEITFPKNRTIGTAVFIKGRENLGVKNDMQNEITSTLITKGFDVTHIPTEGERLKSNHFERAVEKHTDYLLVITLEFGETIEVGPYSDMLKTTCSATLLAYGLPGRIQIPSGTPPTPKVGMGATENAADYDAYSQLKELIITSVETMAGRFR